MRLGERLKQKNGGREPRPKTNLTIVSIVTFTVRKHKHLLLVPPAEAALGYEQHCGRMEEDQARATCQSQTNHSDSDPQETSPTEREPDK